MASHDAETLEERSAVVLVGHAAIEVVGNHFRQAQELQMLALGTLHDAYAPVDVGREAVAQVVRLGTGYVCAGVERLVAHQHAVTERAPVEFVGRSKSARMQHNTLFVDDVRVAVEHGRQFSVRSFVDIIRYLLKRIVIGQRIAGVEEHHVVARSETQSLVHGVVESAVGLRDDAHVVFGLLLQTTLSVSLRHLHGVVLRRTVYYQVFYLPPRLIEYAVERRLYDVGSVVGAGYYREFYHNFLFSFLIIFVFYVIMDIRLG